jgi:hypothetical protein
MDDLVTWRAEDIDLSDLDFWRRPWPEREEAFKVLRRDLPISFHEEPVIEGTSVDFPKGAGYYALTRHRDVSTASRHPRSSSRDPVRSPRWTCLPRWWSTSRE